MSSSSGGSWGGRRLLSGRPMITPKKRFAVKQRWESGRKRIRLSQEIYKTWNDLKASSTFSTDSSFAAHLLSLELQRRERVNDTMTIVGEKRTRTSRSNGEHTKKARTELVTSTPIQKHSVLCFDTPFADLLQEKSTSTTAVVSLDSSDVDVENTLPSLDATLISTGNVSTCSYQILNDSVVINRDESEDDSSAWDSESSDENMSLNYSREELESALFELNREDIDRDSDDESEQSNTDESSCFGPHIDVYTSDDDNIPTTSQEPVTDEADIPPPDIPPPDTCSSIEFGPYPQFSRLYEQGNYKEELKLIRSTKVICSLDLLLEQFHGTCQHPGCSLIKKVDYALIGTNASIRWICPAGHKGRFCTSHELHGMRANNLQMAAAILLSGNNFAKISRLAEFLGLSFISSSTFHRMQRIYFVPAISEWWGWMRGELIKQFEGIKLVLCGDGQCDSPGFSAKNLCYFLMELVSEYIIEVEILDKRHVEMKSTLMEKKALEQALARIKGVLNIVEVCTDASVTIKKLLADNFEDIFHSLDIWHKAKSIRKCILKVSSLRGNQKINQWTDHIINHFWYCCSVCRNGCSTDEEALENLKTKWVGLLHHVCNQHEWTGGKCDHEELGDEHDLPWFDRRDKDYEALQEVILDPGLLESFKYYVRFRHTGGLECANSVSLGYSSKRCAYSFKVFRARKQLAAIDWNSHVDRGQATNKSGDKELVTRKYNQRTKEWNSKIVKVEKTYSYIPMLMAKIFHNRLVDTKGIRQHVSLSEDDPARIAPTIARAPPVSSAELFAARQARTRFPKEKVMQQEQQEL